MHVNQMFPPKGNFLKSEDITAPTHVTIAGLEEIDMDTETVYALVLQGMDKKLRLNKTNAETLAMMYGPDSAYWTGQQVVVVTEPVTFQGKPFNAIRLRNPNMYPPQGYAAGAAHVGQQPAQYQQQPQQTLQPPPAQHTGHQMQQPMQQPMQQQAQQAKSQQFAPPPIQAAPAQNADEDEIPF